jgi:hypothetical protein
MKLFKVKYQRMSHPSKGLHWEEHEAYYTCKSLDKLYDYVENEQHFTVLSISILECTAIEETFILSEKTKPSQTEETPTIIRAM